jgi:hypothetical protein
MECHPSMLLYVFSLEVWLGCLKVGTRDAMRVRTRRGAGEL